MSFQDHLKPAVDTFETAVKSRWDHPVAGPFIFSWVVFNFDYLMVLFSDGAYNSKLTFLQENFPLDQVAWRTGFALVAALIYVISAQLSNPLQSAASVWAIKAQNWINKEWMPGRLYSQEEMERVQAAYTTNTIAAQREAKSALESKDDEIAALKSTLRTTGDLFSQAQHMGLQAAKDYLAGLYKAPSTAPTDVFQRFHEPNPDLAEPIATLGGGMTRGQITALSNVGAGINLPVFQLQEAVEGSHSPLPAHDLAAVVAAKLIEPIWGDDNQLIYRMTELGKKMHEYLWNIQPAKGFLRGASPK